MTLLIHLGYLAYDAENKEAYVPNNEVKEKLIESIEDSNWDFFVQAVKESKDLFNSVLRGNSR